MTGKENAFKVSRKNYEANFLNGLRDLRSESELFDITLACSDSTQRFLQAHRVVLSACSAFFKTMFRNQTNQHSSIPNPYIYLKGVSFKELNYVLDYMYQGEVNVNESDLDSFLAVSEELEIEGLSTKDPEEKSLRQQKINGIKTEKPLPRPYQQSANIPIKQPIKAEAEAMKRLKRRVSVEQPLTKRLRPKLPVYGDMEMENDSQQTMQVNVSAYDTTMQDDEDGSDKQGLLSVAKIYDSEHSSENIQENYSRDPESKMFKCIFQEFEEQSRTYAVCGYETKAKQCIEDHVTAKHFPQKKPCAFCNKLQKDGGSLRSHMYACSKRGEDKVTKDIRKQVKTESVESTVLGF